MDKSDANKNDRIINLETRIFPLLNLKEGIDGGVKSVNYLGTCFLLNILGQDVFVTARHLLNSTPEQYNLYLSYCEQDGKAAYINVRCAYVNNVNKDVAFFIPTHEMKQEYENSLFSMKLLREKLTVGQGVLLYGFADSHQSKIVNRTPIVDIKRNRFEGKVIDIEDDYPLTNIKSVYRLDIAASQGLSGSPLLVIYGNEIVVAGYVIGEQSSNGEQTAICSDVTPLIEIEKLLLEVSQSLRKSKNGRIQ